MKIKAVPVSTVDFSKYGTYYNMNNGSENVVRTEGDGWKDSMTESPLIDSKGSLGFTIGSPLPSKIVKMERHLHTKEALFCMSDSIVLAIANSGTSDQPRAEDIEVFIISPGEVIVLNKGIWHDACYGIEASTPYYWFAEVQDEPTKWVPVIGGPIELDVVRN